MTIEDLALLFVRGVGSRGAKHLIDHFGTAERLYQASYDELISGCKLRPDIAQQITKRVGFAEAEREIKYARRHDLRILSATDEEYPELLADVIDRPHILFVRGDVSVLRHRTISMVGTREISPSGHYAADKLIGGLASEVENLCVVSGLAYGVDGACHRAALAHGVATVAVVADVLPNVSPAAHRSLADDILKSGGAIVSELHSATHQNGNFYIARNRIITGLSEGTIVVESPATGGSLATANIADSYGRTVMAVPGRISDSTSFGTNNLIRSGKARLILTAHDVIDDLGWERYKKAEANNLTNEAETQFADLPPTERAILDALSTAASLDLGAIISATGLSIGELTMSLMSLELKDLVRTLPGNRYERV